jgi:hypothetical protein
MPFGFVDTARTLAGISVVAASSTSGIQWYQARSGGSLGLGNSSSVFFARTHELLQYHFRTVALAFEYDKDGPANCRAPRVAHSRDGKGLRGHETLEAYSSEFQAPSTQLVRLKALYTFECPPLDYSILLGPQLQGMVFKYIFRRSCGWRIC